MQDECSFVSLRDVDRTLQVMMWFFYRNELFDEINKKAVDDIQEHGSTGANDLKYQVWFQTFKIIKCVEQNKYYIYIYIYIYIYMT